MASRIFAGTIAAGLVISAQVAVAGPDRGWHGERYGEAPAYEYADVIDVEPMLRQVRVSVPVRECYEETRYEDRYARRGDPRRPGTAGAMILGGIVGAAIGNQIGRGDGRRTATVAGAIIGSALGHDAGERARANDPRYGNADHRRDEPYTVERCDTRYREEVEERVEGYRVTYEYAGRRYTTRLPYDPGKQIRVRVDVEPDDYR
ncbi:MAG: glycine zipper 2TM domain-containing protein [Steroidobacteraceae bacterium]